MSSSFLLSVCSVSVLESTYTDSCIADQYTETKPKLKLLESGERVVVDREITVQCIYGLYYWHVLFPPYNQTVEFAKLIAIQGWKSWVPLLDRNYASREALQLPHSIPSHGISNGHCITDDLIG